MGRLRLAAAFAIALAAAAGVRGEAAAQTTTAATAALAQAEDVYQAALLGADAEGLAAARNRLALARQAVGEGGRAALLWQEALADLDAAGVGTSRIWFDIAMNLARHQAATGDGAGARDRLAGAIDRARATPFHGAAVFAAADLAFSQGAYQDASAHLIEGLLVAPDLVRGVYGALFVAFAEAQEKAEAAGARADASALIDARVAILQTFMGAEAADPVQTLLFQKYFLLHQAGAWGEAADAIAAWGAAGPIDAEERAFIDSMATLQLTHTELSGYTAPRDLQLGAAQLAVAFTELLADPLDPRRAQALRARAAAETGLGLHLKAAETLLQAGALLDQTGDARQRHFLYAEMATNAWQRGELVLADAFDGKAEASERAARAAGAPPLDPIDRAIRGTNRALLALDLERPREALERLDGARADYAQAAAGGALKWNERREASRIEAATGLARAALGEPEAARAATRRAVALARETLPAGHPDLALTLGNAADLLFTLGLADEALPLLDEAVAINAAALPADLPQAVEMERKLALFHLTRGNAAEATSVLERVTEARKAPAYRDGLREAAIDFELLAMSELGSGQPAAAIEAMQWTGVTRSAEALAQMEARFSLEDPGQALLLRRRQDLREAHRRAASGLLAAFGAEAGAAERRDLATSLADLEGELARVEASLSAAGLDVPGRGAVAPLPLEEIEALLGPDEALVMFVLPGLDPKRLEGAGSTTNRVVAITREGVHVAPIPEESRRRLRRRIAAFRCQMATNDAACSSSAGAGTRGAMLDLGDEEEVAPGAPAFDTTAAYALWQDLFGGIAPAIAGKAHLVLVPPADLLDLPFAALVTSPEPAATLGEIDWLIRRHAISVLPSVAGLKTLRGHGEKRALAPFLGVGDPAIGSGGGIACEALTTVAMRAAAPTTPVLTPSPSGLGLADVAAIAALPRLPDAACEVAAIADAVGEPSRLLLGAAATETAIKAMNDSGELAGYRALVFATHGLVAGEAGAAAPGLVLTPPAEASLRDDGLLSSAEIATLRLDAELVVLSACNTAAGENGDADGLSGLARAFFQAGARSLLVTHWAVFSEAAVMISTGALSRLKANPALRHAEALRAATLAILDTPGQTGTRLHPSFWAAFTIVGAT